MEQEEEKEMRGCRWWWYENKSDGINRSDNPYHDTFLPTPNSVRHLRLMTHFYTPAYDLARPSFAPACALVTVHRMSRTTGISSRKHGFRGRSKRSVFYVSSGIRFQRAAKEISDINNGELDCLIHNAALTDINTIGKGYGSFATWTNWTRTSSERCAASLLTPSLHAPSLTSRSQFKRIVAMSSAVVDPKFIRAAQAKDSVAYGMTKSAELIAATKWALHLEGEGFVVILLSPGQRARGHFRYKGGGLFAAREAMRGWFAQTGEKFVRMGYNDFNTHTVQESVAAQLKVIDGLRPEDNGKFFAHSGEEYPL
ncbi:uncharacterized protein BXZ73DRAFT_81056 [Epithele typhae]|uniref:uncharacterized protein n=1 Tax=Epithele typhae TaxID=378194 RepID=UPI002008860D|nr:uncharacterized protein BXZ73DRAFT_81056 [Epithele typhae]KAH9916609.1 hypothetical protein BXZ73DRAFT_81056 [Epithele typhae]